MYRWSGFPTITATCKQLASPAAGLLAESADCLVPCFEGKLAQKPVLLKAIEAAGWITSETLLGDKPLWKEIGRFDERGHALGADLATQAICWTRLPASPHRWRDADTGCAL